MSTCICFDFGNTRLKAAIFTNKELQQVHVFEAATTENIKALLLQWKPEKTILASVIHHDKEIEHVLAQHSKFHLLGPTTQINFTTPVGKPESIGADRIALILSLIHI